jgi:hypothetical protein
VTKCQPSVCIISRMGLLPSLPLMRRHPRSGWAESRRVAAIVTVDGGRPIRTELDEKPEVGAELDVGFPVLVTETKVVLGGGVLVQAEDLTIRNRN